MISYTTAVDMFDKKQTNIYDSSNCRIGNILKINDHKFEAESTEKSGKIVFMSYKNALSYVLAQIKTEKEIYKKEKYLQKKINWYAN